MIIIPISCISVKSVDINEILFVQKPGIKKPSILITTGAEYEYLSDDIFDYLESKYDNIFIRVHKHLIINLMHISCIDSYYRTITFYNNKVINVSGVQMALVTEDT